MMARINWHTLDIEVNACDELVWMDGTEALDFVRRVDQQKQLVESWDSHRGDGVAQKLYDLFGGEIFEHLGDRGWIPPANLVFSHVRGETFVVYNKRTRKMAFVKIHKGYGDEESTVEPVIPTKDLFYTAARYTLLSYLKAVPEPAGEE